MNSIFPSGIIRNTPDQATVDGALLEAINTRNRYGARRGVGEKVKDSYSITGLPDNSFVYYHPQSGYYICLVPRGDSWYIEVWQSGPTGGAIKYFGVNPSNATVYSSILSASDALITHMGNFVYVSSVSSKRTWILYWNITQYVELERLSGLKFAAGTANNKKVPCEVDVSALTTLGEKYDAIIGEFTKIVAEQRKQGFFNGHVMLRVAYKLFDGSYVLHSEPYYVKGGYVYRDVPAGDLNGLAVNYDTSGTASIYNDDTFGDQGVVFDQIRLYVDATGILEVLQQYEDLKLIQSVCVFCSSVVPGFTVPETYSGLVTHTSGMQFFPYDIEAIKGIADPASLFLVKEWTIDELGSELTYDITNLENIELNEGFPVDNFTHHVFIPGCEYTLNNKIHAGALNTVFGSPLKNFFRLKFSDTNPLIVPDSDIANLICNSVVTPSTTPTTFEVYATVELLTDNGIKKKTVQLTENFYEKSELIGGITITTVSVLLNPVLIYPDLRARRIVISCKNTSNGFVQDLHTIELKPSLYSNYSYHLNGTSEFHNYADCILTCHELFVRSVSVNTGSIGHNDANLDHNRVQVSAMNNPFVWPAENSYRFGSENNTILGLITAQEPITETVFGQYPLNVFTEGGIFALAQGSGDVLYSNVVEVNKEVLSNPKGLYGLTGGILFITKEGLKVLEGRNVVNLSLDVQGSSENLLKDNMYLKESLEDEKVCELYNYLSGSFLDYIQNAVIGFSNVFQEIILSDPTKSYSFVFNLESKSWHTITETFSQFLLTKGFKNGYFSDMDTEGDYLQYYLQTRPFFLSDAGHKKINQIMIRLSNEIATNDYDAMVLFGSNDCKSWQAIGKAFGTNETKLIIRNLPGHYRYFVLSYAGKGENLIIISFDINFTSRYTNKIR